MLDIDFDEKINELNSEIEALRIALIKADEKKTNLQSAKGLISEIADDIKEKLDLLAQWLPADALSTAVRVIVREVETFKAEIMPVLPPIENDDNSDDDLPDGGYHVDDNPPPLPDDGGQAEEILEQAKDAAEYFAVETFHQEEDGEMMMDEPEELEMGLPSENSDPEESQEHEKSHDLTNQVNNSFTPLEQFGDFISYRQVPGEPGFICYLSANNKERLERWQNFLVVTHSFSDCSEIFTPKDDKEARTFKGKHCLKLRHLSSEALLWIRENYDEKSATLTYKEIPEWKRPPIELSKPYVPSWYVRVDGEVAFTGPEAEARETYAQLIKANSEDQKNWSIALLDNDYAKIDGWFKGEALPVSIPLVQVDKEEVDQELEIAVPF